MSATSPTVSLATSKQRLLDLAQSHKCWSHPFFEAVGSWSLNRLSCANLLRNYDAHAAVLRRLLLKAATIMPEPAVGFVLENVRNEYGNGNYSHNHAEQLRDVARRTGVDDQLWNSVKIQPGVCTFIETAGSYYFPASDELQTGLSAGAISAGAITATEVLAIREFKAMQQAFAPLGLGHHIWFNHVTIEEEHSDESLMLALYFIEHNNAMQAVECGMKGMLDANVDLYDGLLAALRDE